MFTGIVETTGRIDGIEETAEGIRMRIAVPAFASELAPGESVAVDGACLTVETHDASSFTVFLAEETVDRTVLGDRATGDAVNLERAMPADGRFDGHLVQGHVDTTTELTAIEPVGEDWRMQFAIPPAYDRHIVEKGSIALDGISLTIARRDDRHFEIAIIPTTYEETTLSEREPGDHVHVEIDLIAKYVASMLADRGVDPGV